jgi:hypothetical protein
MPARAPKKRRPLPEKPLFAGDRGRRGTITDLVATTADLGNDTTTDDFSPAAAREAEPRSDFAT